MLQRVCLPVTLITNPPCFSERQTKQFLPWHKWLSYLHVKIGADYKSNRPRAVPDHQQDQSAPRRRFPLPHEISTVHDSDCFANLLPKWPWFRNVEEYNWTPQVRIIPFPNTKASISEDNWNLIIEWGFQQKW